MNLALRSSLVLVLVLPVGCKKGMSLLGENHAAKYKTKMAAGLAAANSGLVNEAQTELTAALQSAEKMGDEPKQAAALQQLGSLALR